VFEFLDDEWRGFALCAETDPDLWFPDMGGRSPQAKAICAVCAVREPCLAWAVDNREPYGIWGGLSADERKKLRIRRNRAAS